MKTPLATAREFVKRINAHDVFRLCELMTPSHQFVDALGNVVKGRENLRVGWTGYFEWFRNYRIQVHKAFASGNLVALFGVASGTGSVGRKTAWKLPAAWRAVIRKGLVAEWQVYCDTAAVAKTMRMRRDSRQFLRASST